MQNDNPSRPSALRIRRARSADAELVSAMIDGLARYHGDQPQISARVIARDLFGGSAWGTVLVAQTDEILVGYAILTRTYRPQFGQRGLELNHLFVADAARGRGIGTRLVKAAEREASRLGCVRLTVGTHPDNERAQAFYRGLGFEQTQSGPRFRLSVCP